MYLTLYVSLQRRTNLANYPRREGKFLESLVWRRDATHPLNAPFPPAYPSSLASNPAFSAVYPVERLNFIYEERKLIWKSLGFTPMEDNILWDGFFFSTLYLPPSAHEAAIFLSGPASSVFKQRELETYIFLWMTAKSPDSHISSSLLIPVYPP